MSGSSESGEDMEAGRTNRANDRTRIWAQRPDKQSDFVGPAIFIAEPALDLENPDDWAGDDDGPNAKTDFTPVGVVIGMMGVGWSGNNVTLPGHVGGTGVVGLGGNNRGTGVFGRGGGQNGQGGFGVHGIGGSTRLPSFDPNAPPGFGVVGEGGVGHDGRRGAGVVGVAGQRPLPPPEQTQDVGTFGSGGEGVLGIGENGAGVRGHSDGGNGGVLSSIRRAQLSLSPIRMTDAEVASFRGQPGELLATVAEDQRGQRVASLWFCKSVGANGSANWSKIA